ncbi:MAG TPA: hypothetical protein VK034_05615 [Enhygromyxa sp.]|nr:hypothetical protein [Enhygromyxa sp.]
MDGRATAAKLDTGLHPETRRRALWGFGLMVGGSLATALATGLATIACSPNAAVIPGPVAASPAPTPIPDGPLPPAGGLPMPSLEIDWRPPSAAAGDVEALAAGLAGYPRVGLLVDPGLAGSGELDTMRIAALIGRLAPNTAVRPIGSEGGPTLADFVREDPPLLPSLGASGRTQWATPDALALDVERLHALAEFGDPALLVVGPVGVDTPTWRRLASSSVGTCDPLLDELLAGQRESLRLLEPFLDHADAVLASAYLTELAAAVPSIRAELAEFERDRDRRDFDAQGWARYQCGRRYQQYLQPFASCVAATDSLGVAEVARLESSHGAGGQKTPCPTTPRLFLRGSARIGSVEPSDYIPTECPQLLDRDYVEALRAPARSAAEITGDHLDVRWMILAERLATLAEVYDSIEQLCTPGRRRFSSEDLTALQARVIELGRLYQRDEQPAHDARFLDNDASFHVPGVGNVRQLARFDGGTGSASRALIKAARELDKFARTHAKCVARPGDAPLMAMLIDTSQAKPEFLGFYYEEELWCGELGPL